MPQRRDVGVITHTQSVNDNFDIFYLLAPRS